MDVLTAIAGINLDTPTGMTDSQKWTGILAYAMTPESNIQFITDVMNKEHPLTPLGCHVLADRICVDALGLDMFAASNLARDVMGGWFLFASWAVGKGLNPDVMSPPLLLAGCYQMQREAVAGGEQKDLDKLHLRIFGTKRPWGH